MVSAVFLCFTGCETVGWFCNRWCQSVVRTNVRWFSVPIVFSSLRLLLDRSVLFGVVVTVVRKFQHCCSRVFLRREVSWQSSDSCIWIIGGISSLMCSKHHDRHGWHVRAVNCVLFLASLIPMKFSTHQVMVYPMVYLRCDAKGY